MADRSERSGNSTGLSGINGHRGWQIAAGALVLATIGIIISLFTPMRTGAWPWDDDRDVAVRGELGCQTYDLDAPWGMPHVESFTIRGRDNVWNNDNPLSPTYAVTIPVGWKVEWEMTCSGDKPRSGSFTVGKPAVGSAYAQVRHICNTKVGLQPCVPQGIGGCVTLYITGVLPSVATFEDAVLLFADAFPNDPGGPSDIEACARALTGTSVPSAQPAPEVGATVATIPVATISPIETVAPVVVATVPSVGATLPNTQATSPPVVPVEPATNPAPVPVQTAVATTLATTPAPVPPAPPSIQSFNVDLGSATTVRMYGAIGWPAGNDPVTCTFTIDGAAVLSQQCGVSPSYTTTVSPGAHRFELRVCDRLAVCSDSAAVSKTIAAPAAPPPAAASVTVGKGPSAPLGFRYVVTLRGFPTNSAVTVTCHDSVDPGGFYTFSMTTDGSGNGSVQNQCYSGDGPEHWVFANGTRSNTVVW